MKILRIKRPAATMILRRRERKSQNTRVKPLLLMKRPKKFSTLFPLE
jgi:hypothetical protein